MFDSDIHSLTAIFLPTASPRPLFHLSQPLFAILQLSLSRLTPSAAWLPLLSTFTLQLLLEPSLAWASVGACPEKFPPVASLRMEERGRFVWEKSWVVFLERTSLPCGCEMILRSTPFILKVSCFCILKQQLFNRLWWRFVLPHFFGEPFYPNSPNSAVGECVSCSLSTPLFFCIALFKSSTKREVWNLTGPFRL